jgi:hypothetical protein
MNRSAEAALARLAPIDIGDATLSYIVEALNLHKIEIDQVVPDTDTHITWARILDPATCPTWALGWLAQFVGVRLLPMDTEQQQRDRISQAAGLRRTTDLAMQQEVARTLTDPNPARVIVLNRVSGNPWAQTVKVPTSICPDVAASTAAALRQKRAGVVLTFIASNEPIIDEGGAARTIDGVAGTVTIDAATSADIA